MVHNLVHNLNFSDLPRREATQFHLVQMHLTDRIAPNFWAKWRPQYESESIEVPQKSPYTGRQCCCGAIHDVFRALKCACQDSTNAPKHLQDFRGKSKNGSKSGLDWWLAVLWLEQPREGVISGTKWRQEWWARRNPSSLSRHYVWK